MMERERQQHDSLVNGDPEARAGTVVLLRAPLPLVGVSIAMERGGQRNDSLVNGQTSRNTVVLLHPPLTLGGVSTRMKRGRQQIQNLESPACHRPGPT